MPSLPRIPCAWARNSPADQGVCDNFASCVDRGTAPECQSHRDGTASANPVSIKLPVSGHHRPEPVNCGSLPRWCSVNSGRQGARCDFNATEIRLRFGSHLPPIHFADVHIHGRCERGLKGTAICSRTDVGGATQGHRFATVNPFHLARSASKRPCNAVGRRAPHSRTAHTHTHPNGRARRRSFNHSFVAPLPAHNRDHVGGREVVRGTNLPHMDRGLRLRQPARRARLRRNGRSGKSCARIRAANHRAGRVTVSIPLSAKSSRGR